MAKKKKSAETDNSDNQETFETALVRLEKIVQSLEQGNLSLDESLKLYEEGVGRLKRCYQQLDIAEQKIELLTGVTANGEPVSEAFDEKAMSLEEKQAKRSRRRSME